MTTLVEEEIGIEEAVQADQAGQVVFGRAHAEPGAYQLNRDAVGFVNREAATVEPEALAAFFELIYCADPDYIETPAPQTREAPIMNWEEVGLALAESQAMLRTMQDYLVAVLSEHGIENPESVRLYEDGNGVFRLIGVYENREELEALVNAPEHRELHELYRAVTAGMSLAGSLIGSGALPEEVRRNAMAGSPAA